MLNYQVFTCKVSISISYGPGKWDPKSIIGDAILQNLFRHENANFPCVQVRSLTSELEEWKREYGRMTAELKALDVVKQEKNVNVNVKQEKNVNL